MATHRLGSARSRVRRPLLLLAASGVLAAGAALGTGTVALIATRGTSMEPLLSGGDLAVVVRTGDYATGDVLAYDSTLLGTTVLHRVVATSPEGLTLRGDANTFTDPETVPRSAVSGRMVAHLPRGGELASATRSPWAVVAVGLGVLALPAARRRRRVLGRGAPARTHQPTPPVRAVVDSVRRPRRAPRPSRRPGTRTAPAFTLARDAGGANALALALALLSTLLLAGTGALFTLPTTAAGSRTVETTRVWELTWSGPAPLGATYPDGLARSPQPVFTDLVRALDLRLTLDGDAAPAVLTATVTTGAGWSSDVPVGRSPVEGAGRVDLAALRATLDAVGVETSVPTDAVTLTVTASDDAGEVAVPLTLVGGVLRGEGALTGSRVVPVATAARVPTTLDLGPVSVPLAPARGVLAALVLACALAAVTAARGGFTRTEDRLLAAARPVPGGLVRVASDRTVVDLPTARDLVALARSVERPLLQVTEAGHAWFLVDDGAVLYRLRAVRVGPGHREGVPVSLKVVGA